MRGDVSESSDDSSSDDESSDEAVAVAASSVSLMLVGAPCNVLFWTTQRTVSL